MNRRERQAAPRVRSLPLTLLHAVLGWGPVLLLFALLCIGFGIVTEWLGIALGWWDRHHAHAMLQRELAFLTQFPGTAWGVSAAELALAGTAFLARLGVTDWPAAAAGAGTLAATAASSAVNILLLFAVRLAIVVCALPAFLLVALVALTDGLVERAIRTYCGGVESSFIYHLSKPWVVPAFLLSAALYLSLPISVNPAWWFMPALLLTGLAVYITASKFKKYA